jgi:hypothetical protein
MLREAWRGHLVDHSLSVSIRSLILYMVGLIIILLLLMGCNNIQTAEPEIHLIPQGFVGHVTIYFDVPTGASQMREGNARLYTIPLNGQLRTSFSPNVGIRPNNSTQFYYVSPNEHRTPIPTRTVPNLPPATVVTSNVYVVNQELHYFVDRLDRIDTYKNPAIDDSERQWK